MIKQNGRAYLIAAFAIIAVLSVFTALQNISFGQTYIWNKLPYTHYNNFIIFRQSFLHLLNDQNLYARFPTEHADIFKYSPTFALLMAPFSLLPVKAGLVVWNLIGGVLLFAGLWSLVKEPRHLLIVVALLIPETFTSMSNSQSNTHIAGLLLLCFSALEKQQISKACMFLTITIFIKLFTIVLLPLVLFYPGKLRSIMWMFFWMLIVFFIPAIVTGFQSLLTQYQNWLQMLKNDHSASLGIGVLGLIKAFTGITLHKSATLAAGMLLLLLPLLRIKQYTNRFFRSTWFYFGLIWMVLFNHKAESPTFILVMTGVVLYAHSMRYTGWALYLLIACVLFTSLVVSDLVPWEIRDKIVEPYCIKALFPTMAMLYLFARLLLLETRKKNPGVSDAQQLPGIL